MTRMQLKTAGSICVLFLTGLYGQVSVAAKPVKDMPVISIIIDDLGTNSARHERIVRLPGAISCSFLPLNPATVRLAKLAHSYNKEIMLHLPMESIADDPMGPGGLSLDMTHQELSLALQKDLESVPHATGINNHMGSLLTRHPGHMVWLMKEIKRNGKLFFVDSRTTRKSVAMTVAVQEGVPSLQRDVFLDHDPALKSIRRQFMLSINKAKKKGSVLVIGHPYKNTLQVLEEMLPRLEGMGVRLVAVSELLKYRNMRQKIWHASLSRSQKAAKSLKQ